MAAGPAPHQGVGHPHQGGEEQQLRGRRQLGEGAGEQDQQQGGQAPHQQQSIAVDPDQHQREQQSTEAEPEQGQGGHPNGPRRWIGSILPTLSPVVQHRWKAFSFLC